MARLAILIGIGFMLVGALSYALPQRQDMYRLVPSIVGFSISVAGLLSSASETPRSAVFGNMVCCMLLIVYSIMQLIPDTVLPQGTSDIIADISVILFAMIFIFVTKRSLSVAAEF